ncbi:hypothetical protein CLOM_g18109 [Closterium sp. NIES-68]|nr:hypothetical protein CLOM_g18109 [Closterium sp. NIES-68]GJP73763.1 hypothetical protein CLOP_g4449 [Closterium sp. NIES-67]
MIRAGEHRKDHESRQQSFAFLGFSPPPDHEAARNTVTRKRYNELPRAVCVVASNRRRLSRCRAQSAVGDRDTPSETASVTSRLLPISLAVVAAAAVAAATVRANWRFFSSEWFLTILAKLIGYILITASTVVKLPQIMRIVRSRSIEGLSLPAFELECIGYTVSLLFCWTRKVPFSAYGEMFFLTAQSMALVMLIYHHSSKLGNQRYLRAGIYMGIVACLMSGVMHPAWFEALYNGQTAIFTLSRIPQIWENFVASSTGQLSLTTTAMSAAGCAARLFTSIQEKAPHSMVIASIAGLMSNGVLLSQILAYAKPKATTSESTPSVVEPTLDARPPSD